MLFFKTNVTSEEDVQQAIDPTIAQFGDQYSYQTVRALVVQKNCQ